MLNPSTATDTMDDQTIRKCIGFSQRWRFSELVVTNLFTFRATNPEDLKRLVQVDYARAVGLADEELIKAAHSSKLVIAAWGSLGILAGRAEDVMQRVIPEVPLFCIGTTKAGHPLHPCMAPYIDAPQPWRAARLIPETHEASGLRGGERLS